MNEPTHTNPPLKEVWQCELHLLRRLLEVCDKHGLRIWAEGGTLLGAVRHKGFIPWDDDIDMAMMREDYDKLLAVADKEFCPPLFFQTAYTDKHYIHGHAQLRDSRTAAILPVDVRQPFNQGIFIDIFVYDAIPPDAEIAIQRKKAERYKQFMYWRYYWYTARQPLMRAACWMFAHLAAPLFSHRKMYARYEALFRRYPIHADSLIALNMFSYANMRVYTHHAADYAETLYMDFEDMQIPVPKGWDNVLRTQYGADYMTPRQAPSMHGGGVCFDTRRSYKELLPEMR